MSIVFHDNLEEYDDTIVVTWEAETSAEFRMVLDWIKSMPKDSRKFVPATKEWFILREQEAEYRAIKERCAKFDRPSGELPTLPEAAILTLMDANHNNDRLISYAQFIEDNSHINRAELGSLLWELVGDLRWRFRNVVLKNAALEERVSKLEAQVDALSTMAEANAATIPIQAIHADQELWRLGGMTGVYFLLLPSRNMIKIGKSDDSILNRWMYWCGAFGEQCDFIGYIETEKGAAMAKETEIHKQFAALREGTHELFYPGAELIEFMNTNLKRLK